MGGFGSGRHEYADTPTVEECYSIDADTLTEGIDHPGDAYGTKEWDPRRYPSVELTVHFEGDEDADRATHVRLDYTVDPPHSDPFDEEHPVRLEYTEPNFGGCRPWFRCPGVVNGEACNQRVRKLYLPNGGEYWLCRECYDLGYTSSRTSGDPVEQAELRYRRAFAKADKDNRRPHPNGEPYLPERPKGTHYDTFDERVKAVRDAREEWDRERVKWMRKMLGKLSDGDRDLAT